MFNQRYEVRQQISKKMDGNSITQARKHLRDNGLAQTDEEVRAEDNECVTPYTALFEKMLPSEANVGCCTGAEVSGG